jgi:PD-(D/E)XK nuclease superfamily
MHISKSVHSFDAGPPVKPSPITTDANPAESVSDRRMICDSDFLTDLKTVHDAEIDKDPDELVAPLAERFEARRRTIRECRSRFAAELSAVYELEGSKNPEELLPDLTLRLDAWRAYSVKQMQVYLSALPDDDPLRCPISLFGTLGLGRVETAHTSALTWLLSPSQTHGLGTRLLAALLSHLAKSPDAAISANEVRPEHRLVLSGKYLGRLDVFGTGNWVKGSDTAGWLLAIEAKIDADEGDKQLARYDEWINANRLGRDVFRVFLTLTGRRPEAEGSEWTPMSYLELVRVFREQYPLLRDCPGFHFLRFYLTGVLKDICRWKVPVPAPEACNDTYGVVSYLKTVHCSTRGESTNDARG